MKLCTCEPQNKEDTALKHYEKRKRVLALVEVLFDVKKKYFYNWNGQVQLGTISWEMEMFY